MSDEFEPLDPEHERVEQTEPDPDECEPIDLDALMATWHKVTGRDVAESWVVDLAALVYAVPALVEGLRAARAELDRWKALPTRREYTVDATRPSVDTPAMPESARGQLAGLADDTGRDLWARPLHVGQWECLVKEAPF